MLWSTVHSNQSILKTTHVFVIISVSIKIFVENMEYFENLENLASNLFSYGGVKWNCSALKVNVPKMLLFEVSLLCQPRNFLVF